ncbi:uncharacterized protein HaLaN_13386 [Haematococcus lacustris]|uniref:Uncharacterized protein n=1 Tax=Haematococcus lacustris TaxID=44745 RepID=A0A699ZM55_HAELA|nr:uncharacterized protein HaLaN_13386 [Haematococcus lacustris]
MAWALAKLRQPVPPPFMHAFFQASFSALPYLNATLLWAVARQHWPPPGTWLEAVVEESFKLLPHMVPREVSNMVWAWRTLQAGWPPQAWMDRLFQETLALLPEFNGQELSCLVWGLAGSGCRPPGPWMAAFMRATAPQLPSLSGQASQGLYPDLPCPPQDQARSVPCPRLCSTPPP